MKDLPELLLGATTNGPTAAVPAITLMKSRHLLSRSHDLKTTPNAMAKA